jgi:hypothetical protein
MLERRVVHHCRQAELLYCLDFLLVGSIIVLVSKEVGWMVVAMIVDVRLEDVVEEWTVEE